MHIFHKYTGYQRQEWRKGIIIGRINRLTQLRRVLRGDYSRGDSPTACRIKRAVQQVANCFAR